MRITADIMHDEVAQLIDRLADRLAAKLGQLLIDGLKPYFEKELKVMAQIDDELAAVQANVTDSGTVIDSAVVLINGIGAQVAAAVAAAIAAGATPAELQAVTDLGTAITAKSGQLAAAVAANTPAA